MSASHPNNRKNKKGKHNQMQIAIVAIMVFCIVVICGVTSYVYFRNQTLTGTSNDSIPAQSDSVKVDKKANVSSNQTASDKKIETKDL